MKTILKFQLVLLMLLSVWLNAQTIHLSIPDTSAVRGNLISIPVRIDSSVTVDTIASYQLAIQFNNYYLALDSVIKSGTMTGTAGMSLSYNLQQATNVTIAAAGSQPLQGSGVLLYIRFRVIHSGYSSVSFSPIASTLFNQGAPVLVLKNGTINGVEPPSITISPNQALLAVGDSLQFYVSGGTSPYHWSVSNASVASINSSGVVHTVSAGTTRIVVADATGLIDTTNDIVEIRALKLTIHDTATYVGHTFDLPVYCTSVNGLGIVSGRFTLTFNGNILTPLAVIQTGTILQSFPAATVNVSTKGTVDVAFAGSTSLSGSGILCYVRFSTSMNGGGTSVASSNVVFNETILAKTIDGSVNSQSLSTLNFNSYSTQFLVGDSGKFSVYNGNPPFHWTVSDSTKARIDSTGLLIAIKSGSIQVGVKDALGASGTSNTVSIYDVQVTPSDVDAFQGGQVDVPILLQRFTGGPSVTAFQLTVSYDTTIIKATSVVNSNTLSDGWSQVQNISGNTISIASANTTGFHSVGTLVILRFKASSTVPLGYRSTIQIQSLLFNEGYPLSLAHNGSVTITNSTGVNRSGNGIPDNFVVQQNYPNPFNPSTSIRFGLPERSNVKLTVYNVLGQEVAQLLNKELSAGYQEVVWNAKVSSGIYFYRIEAISQSNPAIHFVETNKMVLLK